jgi:hypothetical protein
MIFLFDRLREDVELLVEEHSRSIVSFDKMAEAWGRREDAFQQADVSRQLKDAALGVWRRFRYLLRTFCEHFRLVI